LARCPSWTSDIAPRQSARCAAVAAACLLALSCARRLWLLEVADFVGDPEIDQRIKGGFTTEYYFVPVLSVYGRYEHTAFISTDAASDFDEDEVRLGVKLRR
jgi:hypothetical protein